MLTWLKTLALTRAQPSSSTLRATSPDSRQLQLQAGSREAGPNEPLAQLDKRRDWRLAGDATVTGGEEQTLGSSSSLAVILPESDGCPVARHMVSPIAP